MLSDPLSSDDEGLGEEVGQFVKGSAIGQSKRIEKRRQRYGDAQAEAERRRLMGRRHADSSGAGPDGDGQPTVSTSIFYALLIAATIVGYSLTDSVGTQQCPAALYLLGMILVQCLCWLPWVLCSPKLRGDVARALSPRSVGGFRVETCFFGVCAPGTCKSRSSLSERLANLKPRSRCTDLVVLWTISQSPANIGTIVAIREFSVVVGAVLGVCVLKEPMGLSKAVGLALIMAGLAAIKAAH